MSDTWRTYRVTGHYIIPYTKDDRDYIVRYAHGTIRKGYERLFDIEVYCSSVLEVYQKVKANVADLHNVPIANVHIGSVEEV